MCAANDVNIVSIALRPTVRRGDDRAGVVHGDRIGLRAADIQPDLHRPAPEWEAASFAAHISP